ncbi:uncharacterized protein LOC144449720 [Glandiceps talaboti]
MLLFPHQATKDVHGKTIRSTAWTVEETRLLVKYIALNYSCGEKTTEWPGTRSSSFWGKCAEYISHGTSKVKRTDMACRERCRKYLGQNFKTVAEAEEAFGIDYIDDIETESHPPNQDDTAVIQSIVNTFNKLTNGQQWAILKKCFEVKLQENNPQLSDYVPDDFLKVSISAFQNLHDYKRRNTLYELGYSIGTMRSDESGPRMPLDRMPFPLIETNCHFFSVDYIDQVRYSEEYVKYLETMYMHFGGKWTALHCGPSFKHNDISAESPSLDEDDLGVAPLHQTGTHQGGDIVSMALDSALGENWEKDMEFDISNMNISGCGPPLTSTPLKKRDGKSTSSTSDMGTCSSLWSGISQTDIDELSEGLSSQQLQQLHGITPVQHGKPKCRLKTMDAKVNVVGISQRNISKRISHAKYISDTSIQVKMLHKAKQSNPAGRWWIKADACDIKKAVRESMQKDWSGDIDLGDGKLQESHKKYIEKHKLVHEFMKGDRIHDVQKDCIAIISVLDKDKTFLCNEHKKTKLVYEKKKGKYHASEDTLFALAWEVDGYDKLIKENSNLRRTVEIFSGEVGEAPMTLAVFRSRMKVYLKNVASKERDAASHLMIFMISDELRNMKPYALPVRLLPCGVIKDNTMRVLKNTVKDSMIAIGMIVVGFVTDGEWNSLRTMGTERPVSIIQLMMEAKSNARQTSVNAIKMYLTMDEEGHTPLLQHDAIPLQDVQWLWGLIRNEGKSFDEAIYALRKKMYPDQYEPRPWTPGQAESVTDCLKSILATYIFRWKVHNYSQNGVDFEKYLYVPELDSQTQEYHMDREDHGHLLKRLTTCLRNGAIPDVDSQRY